VRGRDFWRSWSIRIRCAVATFILGVAASACGGIDQGASAASTVDENQSRPVFTTAHETVGDAVRDFFSMRRAAVQPIPLPHKTHVATGLTCTQYGIITATRPSPTATSSSASSGPHLPRSTP
jgi:hypothetical protein